MCEGNRVNGHITGDYILENDIAERIYYIPWNFITDYSDGKIDEYWNHTNYFKHLGESHQRKTCKEKKVRVCWQEVARAYSWTTMPCMKTCNIEDEKNWYGSTENRLCPPLLLPEEQEHSGYCHEQNRWRKEQSSIRGKQEIIKSHTTRNAKESSLYLPHYHIIWIIVAWSKRATEAHKAIDPLNNSGWNTAQNKKGNAPPPFFKAHEIDWNCCQYVDGGRFNNHPWSCRKPCEGS